MFTMNIFYGENITYYRCFYDSSDCFRGYVPTEFDLTEAKKSETWLEFINKAVGTFYSAGRFEVVHSWRSMLLC